MITRNILDRKDIEKSIINLSSTITNLYDKDCINNITKTASRDIVQNLIYLNKKSSNSSIDAQIQNIVLNSAIRSENMSSGSAELFFNILNYFIDSSKYKKTRRERLEFLKDAKEEIIKSSEEISDLCAMASREDFKRLIRTVTDISDIREIVSDVIFSSSPISQIVVERSSIEKSILKNVLGNIVNVEIPQAGFSSGGRWDRTGVNCILVDGHIENISQLHHFLDTLSENNGRAIILSRSASDEVKNTILYNFKRGTLDVILIEIDYTVENNHLLSDISKLFDSNIINIDMGDTISGNIKDKIFKIERVVLTQKDMTLFSNKTSDDIFDYIQDIRGLKDKIDMNILDSDSYNKILKSIDSRIKFLNSRRYEIKIGKKDIDFDPHIVSKIDKFLRSFPDISSSGIVKIKNLNKNSDLTRSIFKKSTDRIFTQNQLASAFIIGYKTLETLVKAEKVLTIDK